MTPYIQDKLSGDELEAFLEHLEHCRNCQEELEIYFMVDVGLKQLDTGSGTFDIMGALQKRIAESYARVRRMWRFRKMEYAVNTLGVMAVCEWFKSWWWVPLLVLVALIVGGVLFHRTDKGKHFFGWLARKTPVVGNLTVKTACATFCRTMEVLIGSGLTLTDSMDLAASNMGNIYYLEAIRDARALVAEGTPLRESLVRTGIFPPMVSNLVGVGEETGDLQSMMGKVADYYDEEVDEATKKLLNLMEPAIIIFMAVFVVIIVLAIYLPMINMTKAFDKYL